MTPWPTPGSSPTGSSRRSSRPTRTASRRRLGVAATDLGLNRNRHTKRPIRPTDPRLTVIRFDGHGRFADRRPGPLHGPSGADAGREVLSSPPTTRLSSRRRVEKELKAPCVFIQGAAGDQSANPPEGKRDPKSLRRAAGRRRCWSWPVNLKTSAPRRPSRRRSDRSVPVHHAGQFQELDHVPALRAVVLPRADPELLPGVREWHETRDDHGRAQR